ncbi:porin family protein [Bacteroidota bacterium]
MKKHFLFLLFGLIVYTVNSQVSISPKFGFNVSNFIGDYTDSKARLKVQIGAIFNFKVNDSFFFQPGILYTGKGCTFDYGYGDKDAYTLNYLEFPINGVLNLELGTGNLQLFTGPYLGICLSGKYKYLSDENNDSENINIGTSYDDDIKPSDSGINIGLGYLFQKLQIQGGYGRSLISISSNKRADLKNSLMYLNFAYFLNSN